MEENDILIRAEGPPDQEAVARVHELAFGRLDEARLVGALREGHWAPVSLVAVADGEGDGHVLFSPLTLDGVRAAALAPVAVLPEFQNRGIGARLIESGIAACRTHGFELILVVGDPAYYSRFGFSASAAREIRSDYSGSAFQVLELVPGAVDRAKGGHVKYAPPFLEF